MIVSYDSIMKLTSTTSEFTDQQIIAGIKAGGAQQERFVNYIFDTYQGLVIQATRKHKLTEEGARDAYTDAVIALRRQVLNGNFRGESAVSTYLYRIYQNKCIDAIRKMSRQRVPTEYEFPDIADPAKDALSHMSVQEEFAAVQRYMDGLGEICKQVLMDCLFWKYDMEEVAKRSGLPSSKIASDRKYKCLQKLRKNMKK